jgi:hypothetical protein
MIDIPDAVETADPAAVANLLEKYMHEDASHGLFMHCSEALQGSEEPVDLMWATAQIICGIIEMFSDDRRDMVPGVLLTMVFLAQSQKRARLQ